MTEPEPELTARIVPCELNEDGDVMYAAGKIFVRGEQIDTWDGDPIYEWWPVGQERDVA